MTPSPALFAFVAGGMTVGYLVAASFFLRFWTRTRDVLFAAFAAAFSLMGANQAVVAFLHERETQSSAYLLRMAAFVVIIVAIIRKNTAGRA